MNRIWLILSLQAGLAKRLDCVRRTLFGLVVSAADVPSALNARDTRISSATVGAHISAGAFERWLLSRLARSSPPVFDQENDVAHFREEIVPSADFIDGSAAFFLARCVWQRCPKLLEGDLGRGRIGSL